MLSGAANNVGPANNMSDLKTSKNYFSADDISVAGGQASGTNYLLDGGENMDVFSNVNLPLPFPDALQEFSVQTSALSARYGMHPGAVVNAITSSGTNQLHGSLFEFLRNGKANARDYFASKQDSLKRNQFGGTVGGPILRRKQIFGFFGYQRTAIRTAPPSTISYTPTQAALNGDFSQLESAACQSSHASRVIVDPNTGLPFPNNQVPTSRLNQQALNLLAYVPVATDPCGKVTYAIPQPQGEDQYVGRVDSSANTKNNLYGRYFLANYASLGQFSDKNILLASQPGVRDMSQSALIGDTYTPTPHIVNSARVGYSRLAITRGSSLDMINFNKIGANLYQPIPNYMNININGYFTVGCDGCSTSYFRQNNYQVADDVDIIYGKHYIAAGGEWIHFRFDQQGGSLANGEFSFNGQSTNDALLDFMLGVPNSFNQGNVQPFNGRQEYFAFYVHDVIRLTKQLTVQAGVRWEPFLPGREANDRMNHFSRAAFDAGIQSSVYVNAPAGLQYAGDSGIPPTFTSNKWSNIEPRAGIAWNIHGTGRQVIRLGYGLFYDTLPTGYWEDQTAAAPWGSEITLTSPSGGFSNPFLNYPGGNPFPTPNPPSKNTAFPIAGTYLTYPLHAKQTYTNQWNLSYELQLAKDWLVSATYLGNKTTHIWTGEDINSGVYIPGICGAQACSTTSNTNQRRVLYLANPSIGKYYSSIYQADDGANAEYNGLLLKAEHRMGDHYSILANYTYSHCISDADFDGDLGGPRTQDPNNMKGDRGNCGFDIRQGFNLSAVLEGPTFKEHWTNIVAGGWRLAPIFVMHSGTWFSPMTGSDNSLSGVGHDRPNVVGNPYIRNLATLHWIDPNAFVPNPLGTFGNAGSDSLLAPKYTNVDVALSRTIHAGESHQFELRFEAFNTFNHANFSRPNNNLHSSTFGVIRSDAGPRILQAAVKFHY
jgi:hypothetical protein